MPLILPHGDKLSCLEFKFESTHENDFANISAEQMNASLRTSQSFFLLFTLHVHCQTLISSYFPLAFLPQTFPHQLPNSAILHLGARLTQNDPEFLPPCLDRDISTVRQG